jgi:aspartate/glutamate racemase
MITEAIYNTEHGIKANKIDEQTISWLNQASSYLQNQDVDLLIAGCTEVSMMKDHPKINHVWLDPMMLVIETLVSKK